MSDSGLRFRRFRPTGRFGNRCVKATEERFHPLSLFATVLVTVSFSRATVAVLVDTEHDGGTDWVADGGGIALVRAFAAAGLETAALAGAEAPHARNSAAAEATKGWRQLERK